MSNIDIIDVKAGIEEENEGYVRQVRTFLSDKDTVFINVMASPGAGKTTLLSKLIDELKEKYSIAVIEADVDADVDARTVSQHGAKAIQLHTGGSCHMDGRMTLSGLSALDNAGFFADHTKKKLVFLENIGNLVCPAEFDTGADIKLVLLSVPEGDDKPLKYPLMFTVADIIAVTKIDTAPVFDFDTDRFVNNVRPLNPSAPIYSVSAKNAQGLTELISELEKVIYQHYENH